MKRIKVVQDRTQLPRRHGAVLWILAHMVWFRMQERRAPSAQDYSDFLRRARWKAYLMPGRVKRVGNYLQILQTT
jgi:type IV secretory pathway TrbD component